MVVNFKTLFTNIIIIKFQKTHVLTVQHTTSINIKDDISTYL